jgi:hypothetical protein
LPSLVVATFSPRGAAVTIDDAELLFNKASEPDRTEIDIEQAGVNFLEADVLLGEEVRDVHPVVASAGPAVPRHEPNLEVVRIGDRLQPTRIGPG